MTKKQADGREKLDHEQKNNESIQFSIAVNKVVLQKERAKQIIKIMDFYLK